MTDKLPSVGNQYGAPMGRPYHLPADNTQPVRLYLRKVRLNSGGYDNGGAYWGGPDNLYHAFNDEVEIDLYVRGDTRGQAMSEVLAEVPNATFFGGGKPEVKPPTRELHLTLKRPFIITPSLMAGLQVNDGFISITYSKQPGDKGRVRYHWQIVIPAGEFSGDDIQSGCQGGTLQEGMCSLLAFLGACAESFQCYQNSGLHGENKDLFPEDVASWAAQNDDELSMLKCEIEETPNLIEEN